MPGHFGTNLGYTIPYDVFHFSFLNISIPKHYGTIEKCFQSHFETEFGHEKIDFMFFVCRDIMVAQEGLMTYLLSRKRYFQCINCLFPILRAYDTALRLDAPGTGCRGIYIRDHIFSSFTTCGGATIYIGDYSSFSFHLFLPIITILNISSH